MACRLLQKILAHVVSVRPIIAVLAIGQKTKGWHCTQDQALGVVLHSNRRFPYIIDRCCDLVGSAFR
jgi:hypothetical protein